jgi:hypothetical protein
VALLRVHGWPVAAAIVAGFVLVPIVAREYEALSIRQAERRETTRPVVTMTGRIVQRDERSIWIHIQGTKHRDCRYLGLTAHSMDDTGVRHDANIKRDDGISERGSTKPPGSYDIGIWRIWPVGDDAKAVMVASEHDCGGVTVRSIIAEVRL